jgi:hypothetical protein
LSDVDQLLEEVQRINQKLLYKWRVLFDTCKPLYHIQGTVDGVQYYLEATEGISFRRKPLDGDTYDLIKYLPHEDLPTYIGRENELSQQAIKLLKDRLKGPTASKNPKAVECPVRDDIIKEYLYLESRFKTVRRVGGICLYILKTYIENKYHSFYRVYEYEKVHIALELNGRKYLYEFKPRIGFELISSPDSTTFFDRGPEGDYKPEVKKYYYTDDMTDSDSD